MTTARISRAWTPPEYPATTIENDGTLVNRYDARKTLAYVTEDLNNVNNVYMLYWITTETGEKYHVNTNAGLRGSKMLGTFLSLNDLQTMTARGASVIEGGSGNPGTLRIQNQRQTMVSPEGGDKWTGTRHTIDFQDVQMDVTLRPTGGNFYYGGGGGVQLVNRGPDPDYSTSLPGWSWYWANPTTRVEGTITVDNKQHTIDSKNSFALFERQWGNFHIGKGYIAIWLYFSTGEVLISWLMDPDLEGRSKIAFASIWHPNGLHEMIPVGPESRASDISISSETGLKYFNSFFLDLPARDASFRFEKWIRDAELIPALPEQRDKYITISESYLEGTGSFNGKEIEVMGHVEQLSTLK